MSLPKENKYTIEDIYELPEGTRAELINGYIYYMAPPSRKHQKIAGKLFAFISNYIDTNGGSCEPYIAPFAVYLDKSSDTYVEPDISVICDKTKLNDKGCIGAPDWIIEVVSPGSRSMDYIMKLSKYSSSGVREYWIVDYEKNRIFVYKFEQEPFVFEEYTFSDTVQAGIFDNLVIDFSPLSSL